MKNKLFSILIVMSMLLSNMAVAYAGSEFEGEGTQESPYLINTADDMVKLATLTNTTETAADYAGKYYQLTADIDMSGVSYKPISYATNMSSAQGAPFTGTLDGNCYVIKNISFASIAQYGATYGIIGYLGANGVVKNLGVENMTIDGTSANRLCIGGIAGTLNSGITIEGCYVRGMNVKTTSSDSTYTGGIIGRTVGNGGTIKNCYTSDISFTLGNGNYSGGIIGGCGNVNYRAENCYTLHNKFQGWAAATNSYITSVNCYYGSAATGVTAEALGEGFKENTTSENNGSPLLSWEFTDDNEGGDDDGDDEDEEEIEDPYFTGKGTEEEPFEIDSADKLNTLALLTNDAQTADYASKYYQLTDDIDMSDVSYKAISWASNMSTAQGAAFTGVLDGNNHIIKNITLQTISTYGSTYGIIGYLGANGVVKNLGVENMRVNASTASRACIGGIAGSIGAGVTIENCYVRTMSATATPSGSDTTTYAGGIAGRTLGNSGTIKDCYTTALDFSGVTNANTRAGILGSSGNSAYHAENCYTTDAKIQGNTSATNSYMGTTNCYSAATIANASSSALGGAFKENPTVKNDGYPVLSWESTDGYELKEEAADPYFTGKGTEEEPFEIDSAEKLNTLAQLTNAPSTAIYASKYYKFTADIDMADETYTPISWASNMSTAQGAAFTGVLDGNNHVIKNITLKTISTYGSTYGIIGYLGANGVVKNLGVENITVNASTASRACIGGIAGSIGAGVTIENCYVRTMSATAAPSGSDTTTYAGGIAGRTLGTLGIIKDCYTTGLDFSGVTNANTRAGLLGSCGSTGYSAENCYTTDSKTQGNTSATNSYMGTINCYSGSATALLTPSNLGEAFEDDADLLNNGMPILVWEYDIAHPDTVYYTVKSGSTGITDGAKDVSVANPIVIEFDKEMNTDTYDRIQVYKGSTELEDCIFTVQSVTTLSIELNCQYNTEYTIFVSKKVQSVKDENGKSAKADEKEITFRTEPMPKAVTVESVKINGQTDNPSNLKAGDMVRVEAEVRNSGENSSQPVALIVTVMGSDGIMKQALLDTAVITDANEVLTLQFEIPENAGTNPIINVMVWDSITKMNAMR